MNRRDSSLAGSTLIEILVATALIVAGLMTVVLAVVESNKSNVRTHSTATALNVLQSQIDSDSRVPFDQLTDTNPPIAPITVLGEANLSREVRDESSGFVRLKRVRYVLTWQTTGTQTIQTEYELTDKGLVND